MKYPYIGQCYSLMVLFHAEGEGLVLDDALGLDELIKVGDKVTLNDGTNITREYLQNTYGEVVSPEHAEFIIELAELHGFELARQSKHHGKFFSFDVKGFCFLDTEIIASQHCKKITIPLPPKADKQELSEWPQVGDEVMFTDLLQHYDQYRDEYCNKVSKVIARFNTTEGEFITVHIEYCAVMTVRIDRVLEDGALIKPKTPKEELRDELARAVKRNPTYKQFIDNLIDNYNITKKV